MLISEMSDKNLKETVAIQRKAFPAGHSCLVPFERELHRREEEKRLLTIEQAAAFFDQSVEWVKAMCKQGRLSFIWNQKSGFRFQIQYLAQLIPSQSFDEAYRRAKRVKG